MDAETREIVRRLRPDADACPFCGRDPYHYVDVGVGYQRAAVVCCDLGIGLIQYGDEQLAEEVKLRREAADTIERIYAAGFEAAKEMAAAQADQEAKLWRETEAEWKTPKNDLTAHLMRAQARHRAETAERISAAIRSLHPQEPSDA